MRNLCSLRYGNQWSFTPLEVIKVSKLLNWLDYKEGKEAFQSEGWGSILQGPFYTLWSHVRGMSHLRAGASWPRMMPSCSLCPMVTFLAVHSDFLWGPITCGRRASQMSTKVLAIILHSSICWSKLSQIQGIYGERLHVCY